MTLGLTLDRGLPRDRRLLRDRHDERRHRRLHRKVKQVKRVACGFRNHDNYVHRIAIHAGQKHDLPDCMPGRPTRR